MQGVVALVARQIIVAAIPVDDVVAASGADEIVAIAAVNGVIAHLRSKIIPPDVVAARTAGDDIVAGAAPQGRRTGSAHQRIVAGIPPQIDPVSIRILCQERVVAVAAMGRVHVARMKRIVACQAMQDAARAVSVQNVVERVASALLALRTGKREVLDVVDQSVRHTGLHAVGAFIDVLVDDVGGDIDDIDVVAGAAGHRIAASAAIEHIVAGVADQCVVAAVSVENVVAGTAAQRVGIGGAIQGEVLHINNDVEDVRRREIAGIFYGHAHADRVRDIRYATEGTGHGVKAEPCGQSTAVGQGGAVGQRVACVRVDKGICGKGIGEGGALCSGLVR